MSQTATTTRRGVGIVVRRDGEEIGFVPTNSLAEAQAAVMLLSERPLYAEIGVTLEIWGGQS